MGMWMGNLPIHPVQIHCSDHSVFWSVAPFMIPIQLICLLFYYLFINRCKCERFQPETNYWKSFSGWVILVDQTVLFGRCENLQKKWTNSQFFRKIHSFIASKSTFEFISRYKDVQESHIKQNKQFLEQTQATGLNGTPLSPADKTWNGPKVKEKLVSDNSYARLIRTIFPRICSCRIKWALLYLCNRHISAINHFETFKSFCFCSNSEFVTFCLFEHFPFNFYLFNFVLLYSKIFRCNSVLNQVDLNEV